MQCFIYKYIYKYIYLFEWAELIPPPSTFPSLLPGPLLFSPPPFLHPHLKNFLKFDFIGRAPKRTLQKTSPPCCFHPGERRRRRPGLDPAGLRGGVRGGIMAKSYDHLFKLLLIGDSGVGKTCLIIRFAENNFSGTYISTIGIDFKIRTVEIEGKRIKLQVWDTAGQERFKTITTAYYRGAMGIILVYDITDEKSFENIQNWMKSIKENASAGVERLLLGNKCDMENKRKVPRERAEKLSKEHGIRFFETSAKSSINVEEAFNTLAQDILLKSNKKSAHPAKGPLDLKRSQKTHNRCSLV
ncbi:hypothetical protein JRQ81_009324 [Phrynocephalus forsythii]|uniref:Ras-related protein Rab-13 n=1 Tax=Phrynocephalus forsythii TaxID=171643 RepID=A0A9Q0XA01_9SAUR|nr:hypothetical protein JRQ81_009324 [Phrynocephalus forsythii]